MTLRLAAGGQTPAQTVEAESRKGAIETPTSEGSATEIAKPLWHYGGFVDLGYSLDFNFPENHLFRNRSTTPRVNELDLNMAEIYIQEDVTEQSLLGMELLARRAGCEGFWVRGQYAKSFQIRLVSAVWKGERVVPGSGW